MAEKLKIIPLGGLDEIGKNITAIEYGKDMIIIDCGVGFPDEEMYGVDLVIPDFTYLVQNEKSFAACSSPTATKITLVLFPTVCNRFRARFTELL
mgnify:CR=1 FL=1